MGKLNLAVCIVTTFVFACNSNGAPILSASEIAYNTALEANKRLAKTINFSALEAPNEGEWASKLEETYFDLVKTAGFTAIRLPVKFSNHASKTAPYTLDPAFMERVDWAVQTATSRGLAIIVDFHHYYELMDEPQANKERFLALWTQIAERYKSQPSSVLFELHNEPEKKLEPLWNQYAAEALAVVRKTNPNRTVIIGSVGYNSANRLADLRLPDDQNLIVTVHNYAPVEFTHQGAPWYTPALPTGVLFPTQEISINRPWQDYSFGAKTAPSQSGLEVTYLEQNGGLNLHNDSPMSGYSSLRIQTNRDVELGVSCIIKNGATNNQPKYFRVQALANVPTDVSLSSCGDGTAFQDVWVQKNYYDQNPKITFQKLEAIGTNGTTSLIMNPEGQIRDVLNTAAAWGQANKRPIFMGEFGAFEFADMASRVRWTKFVREEAEKRGISWAYWEFHYNAGLYDPVNKAWRTNLLNTLFK